MTSSTDQLLPATDHRPAAVIRRSSRRRRSVSARWEEGRILLMVPAKTSTAQAEDWLEKLLPRLRRHAPTVDVGDPRCTDEHLARRARALAAEHLGSTVAPTSIRWVTNQNTRWGSTTPARGSIRISHRLQGAPDYVLDFVIFHELCHLIESGHGPRFRRLEARCPHQERARAFLEGAVFAVAQADQRRSG